MIIKSLPEDERPIEKSRKYGIGKLSNSELIALIIRTGSKNKSAIELAQDIISEEQSGIRHLAQCQIEELEELKGVGPSKAASIMAAVELGKRIATSHNSQQEFIESSEDIARLFMEELRYQNKEYFKTLILNTKGKILAIDTVSIGQLSSTEVHPREVFSMAMKKNGAAVVFVHNHPSGDPSPSDEDIRTTQRLVKVGELVGIPVLDHLIIGDGKYISLRGKGLI